MTWLGATCQVFPAHYSLFTAGVAVWLVYGIMLGRWHIIIANVITLALAGLVLALKILHK
jgi:MtN3 and saliva related transmembrane protein